MALTILTVQRILAVLLISLFVSSCYLFEEEHSGDIAKEQMIRIVHARDCMKFFPNTTTFDGCIFRIQPYFDKLTLEDKKEVAIHFIMHGNLQLGSSTAFAMLIDPFRLDLLPLLEKVSDNELRQQYAPSSGGISRYRKRVSQLREQSISR